MAAARPGWHHAAPSFQNHNGDDNGEYAVTERFESALSHDRPVSIQGNFHLIKTAAAAGNKKINKKIGSSSLKEYPACATPIHMLAAATTNQIARKTLMAAPIEAAELLPASLATATQATKRTKPPRMMIIVRMTVLSARYIAGTEVWKGP
jgi:hypothetical protein